MIVLHPAAEATIRALCLDDAATETGGACFGYFLEEGGAEIVRVCGPGPAAARTPTRLVWDADFVTGEIERTHRECHAGTEFVGRWHRHPSLLALASSTDREWAQTARQDLGLPLMIDLIVATAKDGVPRAWCGYLCDAEGYRQVIVQLCEPA